MYTLTLSFLNWAAEAAVGGTTPTPPPSNNVKYWFDGLPFDALANTAAPTTGLKYWSDGLPVAFIG